MWPKRKKGKARATKVKLKALQPSEDQSEELPLESSQDKEDGWQDAPLPPVRSPEEEAISGVWKSKVLNKYKQNPKDSHNLLARIPTGKAAFEAGERQKNELIKESMIRIVDRMFDNFQNTAYEFNQVTGGSDLELSWIRPTLQIEEVSSWHDNQRTTLEVFCGRISTRYWTLAVRGTIGGIGTYILPSDKLLGFSTKPSSFGCYLSIIPESDGMDVTWKVANNPVDPELFPSIYRALLDGLIRFASDEAQPNETFRLEDIGIVPEAPPAPASVHTYQESAKHDLLGQSSARNMVVSAPKISTVQESRADRFIDDISNQVAQAAQSETDRFRESMHAPPFGTTQRPQDAPVNSGAFRQSEVMSTDVMKQQTAAQESEWKSVSGANSKNTDWRQFMESTKEHVQTSASRGGDDKWNTVPGTEQLARPDVPRATFDSMMQQSPAPSYPSYGNATDPPELLKPEEPAAYAQQTPSNQSGVYSPQPSLNQSGAYSAQGSNQSGAYSAQSINQSGAFSSQHMSPSMMSSTTSGMKQQLPPSMMSSTTSGMQQQLPPLPAPMQQSSPVPPPPAVPPLMPPPPPPHPGLMSPPPGMPSFPGMINPNMNQSGVHPQPMMPGSYPGMPMPPQGLQPLPPHMMPGQPGDISGQFQRQFNTGPHGQLPPHIQQQYHSGAHGAVPMPPGYPPAQPMPPQFQQQPQSGPQHYGMGQPGQDSRSFGQPVSDDHAHYLLSESDFQEQEEQYQQGDEDVQEEQIEDDEQNYAGDGSEGEEFGDDEQGWDAELEGEGEEVQDDVEDGADGEVIVEEEIIVEEETIEVEAEAVFEHTSMTAEHKEEVRGSFPQESFNELPVMSDDTVKRFEAASKAGFVFSSENDFVDAISVVLDTIDSQIELLAKQGTEAFSSKDFRRAEAIIRLSERLTTFKTEAQEIIKLLSD